MAVLRALKETAQEVDNSVVRLLSPRAGTDGSIRGELNATLARCKELFLERKDAWLTRELSDWVDACLNPLCSTQPPSSEERRALAALAFGGWCWREVEGGDRSVLVPSIGAAHRAALAEPSVPEAIVPAWTSWKFLEDGGRPGLGSPGRTVRARLAFFEAASRKFTVTYAAPADIDDGRGRAAFEHGVVLNDVERLALHRAPVAR